VKLPIIFFVFPILIATSSRSGRGPNCSTYRLTGKNNIRNS